jgi:hypothetical protein
MEVTWHFSFSYSWVFPLHSAVIRSMSTLPYAIALMYVANCDKRRPDSYYYFTGLRYSAVHLPNLLKVFFFPLYQHITTNKHIKVSGCIWNRLYSSWRPWQWFSWYIWWNASITRMICLFFFFKTALTFTIYWQYDQIDYVNATSPLDNNLKLIWLGLMSIAA